MKLISKVIAGRGVWALLLITLVANVLAPWALCFDCEFEPKPGENQWGHVENGWEGFVAVWTMIFPFIGGLAGPRGCTAPFATALIVLLTQPLGGVTWLSLKDNEGPIILIFLLPMFCFIFTAGLIARLVGQWFAQARGWTKSEPEF